MALETENIGEWQGEINGRRVKELILIDKQNVLLLDNPVEEPTGQAHTIIYGNIGVTVDTKLYRMIFAYDTCNYNESASEVDFGTLFDISFSFEIPKINPALSAWLFENKYTEFIAVWRDANLYYYISGDMQTALKLNHAKAIADRNLNLVNISGPCRYPTFNIEGFDLVEIFQSVEFTDEFNIDFA